MQARKEADLGQWKELYETATRIKELKPWEKFWDHNIIAIRRGDKEDTVFFSILGGAGECYGIVAYEGYEGWNKYLIFAMQEQLNMSVEYAMFTQKNLTCYWGDRDELSSKQRKIIKDLGYSYRGRNQWLYFMSFKPGYYPYNPDSDEVTRLTGYYRDLEMALKHYYDNDMNVDFDSGKMYLVSLDRDKKTWNFGEATLPFMGCQLGTLTLSDEEILSELSELPKNDMVLEADVSVIGASISDRKYIRPANAALAVIAEATTGMILNAQFIEPDADPIIELADKLLDCMFKAGIPKQIRVCNGILYAGLEDVCKACNVDLRMVKRLPGTEDFIYEMKRMKGM